MDKNSAGVITFSEIARIINNNAFPKEDVYPYDEMKKLVDDLSDYFKTIQNTDFNKKQFKKECLE